MLYVVLWFIRIESDDNISNPFYVLEITFYHLLQLEPSILKFNRVNFHGVHNVIHMQSILQQKILILWIWQPVSIYRLKSQFSGVKNTFQSLLFLTS